MQETSSYNSPENHTRSPDWVDLKPNGSADGSMITRGNLSWRPNQMPNDIQVNLAVIKHLLPDEGIQVFLERANLSDRRSKTPSISGTSNNSATAQITLSNEQEPDSEAHLSPDNILHIKIDFDGLLYQSKRVDGTQQESMEEFARLIQSRFERSLLEYRYKQTLALAVELSVRAGVYVSALLMSYSITFLMLEFPLPFEDGIRSLPSLGIWGMIWAVLSLALKTTESSYRITKKIMDDLHYRSRLKTQLLDRYPQLSQEELKILAYRLLIQDISRFPAELTLKALSYSIYVSIQHYHTQTPLFRYHRSEKEISNNT